MLARPRYSEKEINESADQVVDTLESNGLNQSSTLIVGGGALACCGIRPANDVDVIIASVDYSEMLVNRATPNGTPVFSMPGITRQPWLTAQRHNQLTLDMTYPTDWASNPSASVDESFLRTLDQSPDFNGWKHLTPEQLLEIYKSHTGRKARKNVRIISRWMKAISKQ